MRVGMFGGTFDPPHIGHLIIGQEALERAGLDLVLFVPALVPPHKRRGTVSPFEVRLAMVEQAVAGNPGFQVSSIEGTLPAPSFTVDTLRALRHLTPSWTDLHVIMGSDSLLELPAWKTPDALLELAGLVVYPRHGAPARDADECLLARAVILDVAELPISSTALRHRVREGKSLRYWVPETVASLIAAQGLYVGSRESRHE